MVGDYMETNWGNGSKLKQKVFTLSYSAQIILQVVFCIHQCANINREAIRPKYLNFLIFNGGCYIQLCEGIIKCNFLQPHSHSISYHSLISISTYTKPSNPLFKMTTISFIHLTQAITSTTTYYMVESAPCLSQRQGSFQVTPKTEWEKVRHIGSV